MNVYGRAELQRTVIIVLALPAAAGATNAFAREFRATDTQMMRALGGTPVELPYGQVLTGLVLTGLMLTGPATRPFDGARYALTEQTMSREIPVKPPMAGEAPSHRDPDSAKPIERIRKVE